MRNILFVASVKSHILTFHLPFLKLMRDAGYEIHVAAKDNIKRNLENCDKFFDINFERNPFSKNNIQAYCQLKKIICDNKYDIIHCHTPVASVLVRLAARNCKETTVIYTAHGFHFFKGAPLINWILYYPVEKFCSRYTDKLITINTEDFNRVKNWKLRNNGKVYYVPGVGVDIEKINNIKIDVKNKKQELCINNNKMKILLSVGELNKNKNHEVIIKALSKMKRRDFIYFICGEGILHNYLDNIIRSLELENNIKLLGYRNDILEILKITDLFIFPSKREGLPVSLMEAIASGVACIASDVRGNRDLLNEQFLCNPENENDWFYKLNMIIEDDNYKYFNKNFLNENFSLNHIKNEIKNIYMEHI